MLGLVTALLVVAGGLAGWRVLAPNAISDQARTAYPGTAATARPVVYGTLLAAPIVIDGRLRVYADKQQVSADDPIGIKSSMSPFWSYRRWPAQLVGVVAVGTTVVSQWSDGALVALDATRGTVAWQAKLAVPAGLAYTGRRTGAGTVWDPSRLYTAVRVVIAAGDQSVRGYDAASGRQLWQQPAAGCSSGFTAADVFVSVATCGPAPRVRAYDAATGAAVTWPQEAVTPVGCALGRSDCRGVRGAGGAWTIGPGGAMTAAPVLAQPNVWITGEVAIVPQANGDVAGVRLADGARLWTATAGRVIAVEPGAVHLVNDIPAARYPEIMTLDPANGQVLSSYPLAVQGSLPFDIGQVYAADGFLFIERLNPGATPNLPDSAYYYPTPNVVVAGS
jgi:outer membrane protein assembly factor BamB